MKLSARHVAELAAELGPLVTGTLVRSVDALPPRDLLLVLETSDERIRRLRFSADAEAARFHLQIGRVERHKGPSDPFFRVLASELEELRVVALEALASDRIVRLEARGTGGRAAALVAELTGRHANFVLLDGASAVRSTLVQPAEGSAAAERLAPGATYALPPGRRASAEPGPPLEDVFPAPPAAPDNAELAALAPRSWRVEAALGTAAQERFAAQEKKDFLRRLERRLQQARAQVVGLETRERAGADLERVRQDAELLMAHLGEVRRGTSEVLLPDSFDPAQPPRRIELDPALSPRRNAERLFARYKKQKRTNERLPEELALARATLSSLEELFERACASDGDPGALVAEALAAGLIAERQAAPERRVPVPRLPYLRFEGLRGSEIRVGRTARDNDQLTFRESRGNDVWLHTADSPGSHVVLRLDKGAEPDPEEVLDAAHLAVHFSPLKNAGTANVHVARCKEVHKPRRAPAGLVTLSGGKVRRVRVERERLARVLATRRTPGSASDPARRAPGRSVEPDA